MRSCEPMNLSLVNDCAFLILRAGNFNAIDSAEAVGSRARSRFRGRGATPQSDLDIKINDFVGLAGSRHEKRVAEKIQEIVDGFTKKTHIPVHISTRSKFTAQRWAELFGN